MSSANQPSFQPSTPPTVGLSPTAAHERPPADSAGTTTARLRIATAAGVALLVAGLVLVCFILPAEFAVDPLGVGRLTGLLDLGETGRQVAALDAAAKARKAGTPAGDSGGAAATRAAGASVIRRAETPFQHDVESWVLGPGEAIEFKYRLPEGVPLLFSWTATAPVNYEAHAEPDGAPRGYAESYEKGTARSASGTLTTPFSGINGWYWENTNAEPVTVTLTAAGHFSLAHEFRAGQPTRNKTFP